MKVTIIGAGIGGLTTALELHALGIDCVLYESAPAIAPIGVGINVLPHAVRVLAEHGLLDQLGECGLATKESVFFNRFGQLIYREPAGMEAGYAYPQFSVHRGDLQRVLLAAVHQQLGADSVITGHHCTGFTQDHAGATAHFRSPEGETLDPVHAEAVIACDGIHSVIRKQLHPGEGDPRYSGVTMWRGVTVHPLFLTGASMVRAGWLTTGKMVIYPIRDAVDARGKQLVNWVAEVETAQRTSRDWNRRGRLEDFLPHFEDWAFDWLDVPALLRGAESVLEYPMVDQDPLPWWTSGRVTLLGDAAHPMVPRGSNGAGQAILDARALREELIEAGTDVVAALAAYENRRRPETTRIVLTNRQQPPDAILREVWQRTGDRPFRNIADVISPTELAAISDGYKRTVGMAREDPSFDERHAR